MEARSPGDACFGRITRVPILLLQKSPLTSAQVGQAMFPALHQAALSLAGVQGSSEAERCLWEPESRVQGQVPPASHVTSKEWLSVLV